MLWYNSFSFVSSISLFLLLNNIVVSAASLIVFFPRLFLVIVARSEGDRRRAGEGEGLLLWEAERHWTHLPGEWKQPSFEQNHGHPVCYRGKYRPKCLLTFSNYSTDQEFGGGGLVSGFHKISWDITRNQTICLLVIRTFISHSIQIYSLSPDFTEGITYLCHLQAGEHLNS